MNKNKYIFSIILNVTLAVLPTKSPLELNSSIKTTTTKLPWIVGVKVISPVFGFIAIPLIGDGPV